MEFEWNRCIKRFNLWVTLTNELAEASGFNHDYLRLTPLVQSYVYVCNQLSLFPSCCSYLRDISFIKLVRLESIFIRSPKT
jgi:hypothetical protein